ncbi:MAG: SGNH/GDSL hydrolase family protein [Bryobacteraceae bacterium]
MQRRAMLTLLLVLSLCVPLAIGQQAEQPRWVTTWATAELLVRPATPPGAAQSAKQPFAAAGFQNQTIRMILRTSIGGDRLRIRLANAFGSGPVTIGAARVALHAEGSRIVPGSDRVLSFHGKPGCTLGPGVVLLSDPVDLKVPPLTYLAVSLYFPEPTGPPTVHTAGLHTTFIKEGDRTADETLPEASTTMSYYWLAGVEVLARADAGVIVALGDSITDGAQSTPNTDRTWPALLAARLAASPQTSHIAVANLGIGGNRVLRDGTGASALARLDRDVLSQPGVRWLMFLEGINDIGVGTRNRAQPVTAEELIAGHKQIIERARAMGLKVIGCTLTPYEGAAYYSEQGEAIRQALNHWIRTSGAYDAVVDFDAATRDPQNPRRFRPEYDPGDHLHPNDKGYQAMADAVDLKLFVTPGAGATPVRKR